MGEAFNALKARLADYTHFSQAESLLSWDQETYMPVGAVVDRGEQLATLSKFSHELFTAPKTGKLSVLWLPISNLYSLFSILRGCDDT